ncbi:hypothetical protein BO94DRAFT_606836, partial [Aspergillus sclerotioniger CBS 115572]
LPLELVSRIAFFAWQNRQLLAPCSVVCRKWQAAFEPLLYSNLDVCSDDIYLNKHTLFKYTMPLSLSQFRTLMSGVGLKKRRWLRTLRYTIALPHRIEDWKALKSDLYVGIHIERLKNDQKFGEALADLFKTLATWNEQHRLSLEITVLGYKTCVEYDTEWAPDAYDYTWNMRLGHEFALPPYRARFLDDDVSKLVDVPCIDRITFPNKDDLHGTTKLRHQTWVGAMFEIIEHCPTLTEAHLDLDEYVRPDHDDLIRERRQALAEGLLKLPRTLKKLHCANAIERN